MRSMKTLRADILERAMTAQGLNASALADKLKVSRQTVSNWINGRDVPRPDKLLRLSLAVKLPLAELVQIERIQREPIVAFRMTAHRKARPTHFESAKDIGESLEALVPRLPFNKFVGPPQLHAPTTEYQYVQAAAASLRAEMASKTLTRSG